MADREPARSSGVAFRALFMFCCLIAIPLAAVLGKTFPDVVDRILAGEWPLDGTSPALASQKADASSGGELQGDPLDAQFVAESAPRGSAAMCGPGGCPVGVDYGAAPRPFVPSAGGSRMVPVSQPALGDGVIPASYLEPSATGPRPQPAIGDQQFQAALAKLRNMGAAHYQLEYLGGFGAQYRFQCQMAVAGMPNFRYHAEATHADPTAAVLEVTRRVEVWSAQRR